MSPLLQSCYRCGGSLRDGYEVREHGRDENGYADEEILCGRCAGPVTKLVIHGDPAHEWDGDAAVAFAECFFEYPDRIQIGRVRYLENA
jgi:hypothetical protein